MNGDEFLAAADRIALGLPRATVGQPFGPDWEVYKVEGKVFQLLTEFRGQHMVTVKADPQDALALRQAFPAITAGYHMNKRHWITITPGDGIDERFLGELVAESYRLVAARLPRARRPAEIDAYLRAATVMPPGGTPDRRPGR